MRLLASIIASMYVGLAVWLSQESGQAPSGNPALVDALGLVFCQFVIGGIVLLMLRERMKKRRAEARRYGHHPPG